MASLSSTATIIAVIDISTKITSLCLQYSAAVKDAKKDIGILQRKVGDFTSLVKTINQLPDKAWLSTILDSLKRCLQELKELKEQLEPGKYRKAITRFGLRALRWPFTSEQVEKIVSGLYRYEQIFTLALQVDPRSNVLAVDPNINSTYQELDFTRLPTAIGASFNSHIDEYGSTCLPNTRVELQRQISEWAEDINGKPMLWLSGMAGTGKTTIARTVTRLFDDQGQLGASFFFKRGEGDRGNATRFFTTITRDLVARVPGLKSGVRKALDADPDISHRALKDQFVKLILQPFLELPQAPQALTYIVVVDALGECEQEQDIRAILHLLARIKDIKSVSLRILVTSRPELTIRLGFKEMPEGTYQDLILHEVPAMSIKHDITMFITHELANIRKQRLLSLDWPSNDQIQAMVELSMPLFIFAATICRYVGTKGGNPVAYLNKVTQYERSTFSRLDQIYLPILNQLLYEQEEEDKEEWLHEFRELVGSIVVLESPLSVGSLESLLQIPQEQIECRLDSLHSVLLVPNSRYLPIRLFHLSFREFLVNPQYQGRSPFWVDKKGTHKKLASHCLKLMSSLKGLRQNMCNLPMAGTLRSEIDQQTIAGCLPDDLQYACRYWVHHLEQSEPNIRDGDSVHLFLQKYLLYWLEAMSLLGETRKCINMIDSLQALTDSIDSASSSFLQDARRFVLQTRSILEDAPLQVYCSAIFFAPELSIIRKTFIDHAPKWICGLRKPEKDWSPLLQTLRGHSSSINNITFSPDGQLIASSSWDHTIRLWDAVTGTERSILEDHSQAVSAVLFSPDGQSIASASCDQTVRLWNLTLSTTTHVLKGHSSPVSVIAFSPDGNSLASASTDGKVRLWNAIRGICNSILEDHSSCVGAIQFSPNGELVASASEDGTVILWDVATGSCRFTLDGHSLCVGAIQFSPDGKLIASASEDSTVMLWDVATGTPCFTLDGHSELVRAVAFSPDGKLVASASDDSTIMLWDVSKGSCRSKLEEHSSCVTTVAFSPDGELIASASEDGKIILWDATTGAVLGMPKHHYSSVTTIAFSPDGRLCISGSSDGTIKLWELATWTNPSLLEDHYGAIQAIAFSPNGGLVASVASEDHHVKFWDASTGTICATLQTSGVVRRLSFSSDGLYLKTDRGELDVNLVASTSATQHMERCRKAIISGDWVSTGEGENILWLPPHFRPTVSAVWESLIAIGHVSGHVSFLDLGEVLNTRSSSTFSSPFHPLENAVELPRHAVSLES